MKKPTHEHSNRYLDLRTCKGYRLYILAHSTDTSSQREWLPFVNIQCRSAPRNTFDSIQVHIGECILPRFSDAHPGGWLAGGRAADARWPSFPISGPSPRVLQRRQNLLSPCSLQNRSTICPISSCQQSVPDTLLCPDGADGWTRPETPNKPLLAASNCEPI